MTARALVSAIVLALAAPAAAQADSRALLSLGAGEEVVMFGTTYRAAEPTRAVVVQSSELVTAAVLEGRLAEGATEARGGEALVTPIDGARTRRYGFDAGRLAASLPLQWAEEAEAPLAALAERQRRRAFWGLIEPIGVNAAAPVTPEAEAFRHAYLGNPTILGLRRAAAGDRNALASLTVQRFAEAVVAGDAAVMADLIDPVPFTQASADPAIWRPARAAFAARLAADGGLASAFAASTAAIPASASPDDPVSFDLGGAFRIGLVMRDRAMFVAEVEPIQ